MSRLSNQKADAMVRDVTDEEIKGAMFSIDGNKAPGPDGYTSVFFKKSWDIVGNDVCKAVKDFFLNGRLLAQLNHTIISLIPKVTTPLSITDYRPISCCNTFTNVLAKLFLIALRRGYVIL